MLRNKAVVWVLVMAFVLSCFPAVSFAAEDAVGEAIFYNRTYDEAGKEPTDGLTIIPKSNSIAPEKDSKNNQYMKIEMADPVTEDCYMEVAMPNPTKHIVIEMDLSTTKAGVSGNIQFKDQSRKDGLLMKIANDGKVTSAGSGKELGTVKKGAWLNVAFALNLETLTYSSYVAGKQVEKDVPVSGSAVGMILVRLYIEGKGAGANLLVDNFKIYEAAAPKDITGKDVQGPTTTFTPSATPTPSSVPTPSGNVTMKGKTALFDCESKKDIEALGLKADTKNVKDTKYSAAWKFSDKPNLIFSKISGDLRCYTEFSFNIYNSSDKEQKLYLRFDSQNAETTDGDDYYGTSLTLPPKAWTEVNKTFSSLGKTRTPIGWHKIDSLKLFSTGWGMENDPETVLYLDTIYFDGSNAAATPTPTANPTDLSRVNDAVCLKLDCPSALVKKEKKPIDENNENVVPFTSNDRTLVPVRFIAEGFGADVGYDGATEKVTVKLGSDTIELTIGLDKIYKNGQEIQIDTAATVTGDDRTFVPLRAIAEALGKEVFWDDMGLIVISDTKDIFNRETDLSLMLNVMAAFTYERPEGSKVIADLKANAPQHPRILANADDFARIKSLYETDPLLKEWVDKILKAADNMAGSAQPPVYSVDDGGRLKGTNTESYMLQWGLAYQMTGDKKYVDAAYDHLKVICGFDNWHPGHFLDAAGIMKGVAIGYDWMYDGFTADQRKVIEEGLYKHGIKAGLGAYAGTTDDMEPKHGTFGRSGWTNTDNNWNAVCNGGLTLACAAIGDLAAYEKDAGDLMGKVLKSIEKGIRCYAPDGSYPEGPGYWAYGTNNLFYMIECLDSAMGTDYGLFNAPGLDTTCYFPNYIEGTNGMWNFNDCGEGNVDTSHLFWVANKIGNPDLAGMRLQDIVNGKKTAGIHDILHYDPNNINKEVHLALDRYMTGIQTVTMRGDWNDSGTVFTGLHGGYNGVNHGNLDSGNFIIDAGGVRFISDIGTENYNLPSYFSGGVGGQRWTYYRNRAEGHNTIAVNPGTSEDQVVSATTKITRFESKPRGAISVVDMAPAHGNKVKNAQRGLLFTDNRKAVVVQDEMMLSSASEVWWFAHVQDGEITVAADGKSAIIEKQGKRMWVGIVSGMADAKFEVMAAEPLSTSPKKNDAEYDRSAWKKLAIYTSGVTDYKLAVEFRLLEGSQTEPNYKYTYTAIKDWTIPDGEIVVPRLTDLTVDGQTVDNFSPLATDYKVVLPYGTSAVPTVDAKADDGYTVEITQAQALPGLASVKVYAADDPDTYSIYDITLRAMAEIEVEASDIPEPANVPENTLDGDLGTRWAAEGEQWIKYTFANPREISAVWIAFWKSDARSTMFKLEISKDGETFETVFDGTQTNKEDKLAEYKLPAPATVKAVRISGSGNTSNAWNSILEVEFK